MSDWPAFIPSDLRMALEGVDGMRCHTGPQDQWVAIKEWLDRHGVEPPEHALLSYAERGTMEKGALSAPFD